MNHDPRTELPQPNSKIVVYVQGKAREALFVHAVSTGDGQKEWTLTFHGDERTILSLADIGLWNYAGRDLGRSVVPVARHDAVEGLAYHFDQGRQLSSAEVAYVTGRRNEPLPVTARLGMEHGREVKRTVTIPGLFEDDGKTPVSITETLVVEEVSENWITARPWGDDSPYVFGEHPLATATLSVLTLLPKRVES